MNADADSISQRLAAALGLNIQDPIIGTVTLEADGTNPAPEDYTVPVMLPGMPELIYAKYSPLADLTMLSNGSPVELKLNSAGEYEIVGLNAELGREAYGGAVVQHNIAGYLHDHQSDEGGGQLNASQVFDAGQVPLARGGTNANLSAANNGTVIKSGASLSVRLDNLTATTNPTTGDDAGDGYSVGSLWVNTTTDTAYLCTDATTGAAVWSAVGSSGSGTVTSVGLALPSEFSVTGSPVTTADTLTATWASQAANLVLASPDGSSGTPAMRALSDDDIPTLTSAKISDIGGVLIGYQELASAASALTVTGIPSTYRHLQIVASLKSDAGVNPDSGLLRFNADSTAANYYTVFGTIRHSAVLTTFEALASIAGVQLIGALGSGVTAARFGTVNALVDNYALARQSMVIYTSGRILSGSTGDLQINYGTGLWTSTSAITRVDIYPNAGTNWVAGSTLSVYGLM